MFIGMGFAAYMAGRIDILDDFIDYGEANKWQMGEPGSAIGEVFLKPNVQIVLRRSADRGGEAPTIYGPAKEDYQKHIQVLLILWEGEVYGAISKNAKDRLKDHSASFPEDVLFVTADSIYSGNIDTAIKLLLKGVNPSSYVRGADFYPMANWLMAARLALRHSH